LLNKSWKGGAANACVRLHLGLLKSGIKSKLLLLDKGSLETPETYGLYQTEATLFCKRVLHHLWYKRPWKTFLRPTIQEGFHFPLTAHDISVHPLFHWADIFHLHWVSDYLDYPAFFKKTHKPVIWTLHDMEPFSGGNHYEFGFPAQAFKKLVESNTLLKKNACAGVAMHITAPSKWLTQKAARSEVFSAFPATCIPNGIDTCVFQPLDKNTSRKELGIPLDKKVLLFVAESAAIKRKGMDYLLEALPQLTNENLLLAFAGKGNQALNDNPKVFPLGHISSEVRMTQAYSAADLFVIPSLEDNLPNTVLESLACGTPVAGFETGGIPDMVKDGFNGFLSSDKNAMSLAKVIDKAMQHPFDAEAIRKDAVNRFDLSVQTCAYVQLYQSLLN
jgi:glycosyltransferase involved in cell wall biosynthesis